MKLIAEFNMDSCEERVVLGPYVAYLEDGNYYIYTDLGTSISLALVDILVQNIRTWLADDDVGIKFSIVED